MARTIHLRGGLDVTLGGSPAQVIGDAPAAAMAFLGRDLGGLHPVLQVAAGDAVTAGQVLFTDRARPQIAFCAPRAGTVRRIDMGPRRTLSALILDIDRDAKTPKPVTTDGDLRDLLLRSGLWPAFQTRPFGRIPAPGDRPEAIFVTAVDTAPLAPDPAVVIAARVEPFGSGLAALTRLTDGPVHLCQGPGADPAPITHDRLHCHVIRGRHPAGLASAHVQRLHPADRGGQVWTIGYQDVIALGAFLRSGRYLPERVIALAGPMVRDPRLLRTCPGVELAGLTEGALIPPAQGGALRLLSGDPAAGQDAAFLGRYDRQVTALRQVPHRDHPVLERLRAVLPWHSRPAPRPILATPRLEHAIAADVLAVPLLRALAVGDAETARKLGALHLVPEDLALARALCASGNDYPRQLTRVLDDLAEEAAP